MCLLSVLAVVLAVASTRAQDNVVRLLTHDSFNVSEQVLADFERESGLTVEIVRLGDAGLLVNQAILTRENPLGDVLYGIDNTFLSRAFDADLFSPYRSSALDLSDIGGVVYNPHFYDKIAMTTQSWSGDLGEMNKAFKAFVRDAERMGTPWMLGEYGCARDTSGKVELLKAHQNALLAHGIGGTVWNYDPSALDWNDERMGLDEASLAVLAHPYPTAIHGQFRAASLDGVFTLDWMSDGVAQPTDVALPDLWKDAAIESSAPYTLAERRIRMSAPAGPASLRLTPAV